MKKGNRVVGDVNFQSLFGMTPICWYDMDAHRYRHETEQSRSDLAAIAFKSREFARHNPLAQFLSPLEVAAVLEAPMVVDPLGLYDVPPVGDGAVCLRLASEDLVAERGAPYARVARAARRHSMAPAAPAAHDRATLQAAVWLAVIRPR